MLQDLWNSIVRNNLFSMKFSPLSFTLMWRRRHRFLLRSTNLSSFVKIKKVNYLIPVSVTKYLCHSLNINSKNFNDSHTKVSFFFPLLLLIAQFVCRFEKKTFLHGPTMSVILKVELLYLRRKNGLHY